LTVAKLSLRRPIPSPSDFREIGRIPDFRFWTFPNFGAVPQILSYECHATQNLLKSRHAVVLPIPNRRAMRV